MNPIPYGFQPIDTAHAVHDAPLWRDGSSSETRFSGEILVTLTAQTPLIVGNHQHRLDDKHSLLVPQMLDDGRVLLAAASLKGMLRTAMASLLQAPMERVAEHHYTYRPNLGGSGKSKELRVAVVLEPTSPTGELKVALLDDASHVVFLPASIWKALKEPSPGIELNKTYRGLKFDDDSKAKYRKKLAVARLPEGGQDRNAQVSLAHTVLRYVGGIDGDGLFAEAYSKDKQIYRYVLLPTDKIKRAQRSPINIRASVVRHYEKTQEILADDKIGHLSPGHPLTSALDKKVVIGAIQEHTPLEPWQLIYVEYDTISKQITSFGHHYQYRWAYTSSTANKSGKKRRELDWLPEEQKDAETGQPKRLAGHRLLFGYALEGGDNPVATGNFKRLAGRIAFNTAIEDVAGKSMDERFMEGGKEIQLRILGMPRPSAVEFYLKQTALPKQLTTYGDLPNNPGGDLAGRKFYRHQPDAKSENRLYTPNPTEKQGDANAGERGTCVRYLSRPGSRFRSTLRFDSLRPWELGALLVALDPSLAEGLFGTASHEAGYAHKLGYGKPLGLGSIKLALDAARWQENDHWRWQQAGSSDPAWKELMQTSLAALKEKLQIAWGERAKDHITTWLKARRWSDRGRSGYPTHPDKKGEATIFNYHTDLRRDHAAARRGANKDFSALKKLLETDA